MQTLDEEAPAAARPAHQAVQTNPARSDSKAEVRGQRSELPQVLALALSLARAGLSRDQSPRDLWTAVREEKVKQKGDTVQLRRSSTSWSLGGAESADRNHSQEEITRSVRRRRGDTRGRCGGPVRR